MLGISPVKILNNLEETTQKEEKRSKNTLYLIIIGILTVLCAVLTWQFFEQKNRVEFITVEMGNLDTEKEALNAELADMLAQYEAMETENKEISAEMEEQKEKIQELMVEAEKNKDNAYIIYKLRKETKTLREIMKGFVNTIDSLNTLNIVLREEKAEINKELGEQKEKYVKLEGETDVLADKVKIGQRLKAINIEAMAQRVKSNGIHRETTKADRADKIKCCFTISKNQIAETGMKDVYLRIITPEGKVLAERSDDSNMFDFNGVKGLYSVKKQILYDNIEQDLCLYWKVIDKLPAGDYIVEAYADEADIGKTGFVLK